MTLFYKFVLPVVWAIGIVNAFVVWNARDLIHRDSFALYVVPIAFLFLLWFSIPLKKVSVANNTLYVSNYRKEIAVPLSEIADVRGNILTEPQRVTIYLRQPSEFGSKIVFMAKHRFFSFWSVHPVVDELKSMAAEAN